VSAARQSRRDGAYSYVAYGARIGSFMPLPPLVAAENTAEPDVIVRRGSIPATPFETSGSEFQCLVVDDEIWIHCGGVGTFRIRGGREIDVDPAPQAQEFTLRSYIVKAALAAILRQQDKLILHASAVAIDGRAAAFIGSSGMGKSTTTAALHARGHPVLADDLVAVDVQHRHGPHVLPGAPHLALLPESARAIGDDPDRLPRIAPRSPKHARDAGRGFAHLPVKLGRIYVLADGERNAVAPIARDDALGALVVHTFGRRVFQPTPNAGHFLQCATLVRSVTITRLERVRDLDQLAQLVTLVEDDIAGDD
jgi:hypothetical protein